MVVAGSGNIGRHELLPYTVHYANPYTGYGPLEAGPKGLSYLTLRAVGDPNRPFYLPDTKDQMKPGPRLNLTSERVPAGNPAAISAVRCKTVMEARPDGIAAWMLRVPPNQSAPAPQHASGGGQYRVVLAGEMKAGNGMPSRLGCAFHAVDESGQAIVAGPGGLEVLVLQYAAQ